jgi:hypothetical protein
MYDLENYSPEQCEYIMEMYRNFNEQELQEN